MKKVIRIAFIIGIVLMGAAKPALAADSLDIGASQSRIVNMDGVVKVAIADPEIADVLVLSPSEVLLIGKKAGSTSLHMWQQDGSKVSYQVVVDGSDYATATLIKKLLSYDKVTVLKAGGKIILEGTVANQYEKARAEKIASVYGETVVNLLEMTDPKQVKIETRVIEIATDKAKKIGLSFANAGSINEDSGAVTLGTEGAFGLGQTFGNSVDGNDIFGWFGSYADVNATLNAMIKTGDAKILSQPYIVTMSGAPAHILIGGEIPIPISNQDGQLSVEWREYGIKLNIDPQVMNNDDIQSKIQAEISSIDYATTSSVSSGGITIPALKTRKAEANVHMKSGMTMAIGGLISSEESKSVSKIPLLGDLPIIGKFFRNTAKSKEQKEIIVLVTPRLVASDYQPTMSAAAEKLAGMTDSNLLRGETDDAGQ